MWRFAAIVGIALLSSGRPAWAEPVKAITVTGLERIEQTTVLSYIPLKLGDDYSPQQASELVKSLYATGLFDHVEVQFNQGTMTVAVRENPLINRVVFEGNQEFDAERLQQMIGLRPRAVYTPGKVVEDVRTLQQAYRSYGYFLVKITPQIIRREQNRLDLIYVIDEGQRTAVERIRFVGNKRFGDETLRSIVATKETRWWRFLTSDDNYDQDRLEFDKEQLRRFYLRHGYADFQVHAAVAELTADKQGFFITYTVHEGQPYTFGPIQVQVQAQDVEVDRTAALAVVQAKAGEAYDGTLIERDLDRLVDFMGASGYAFVDVVPVPQKDEKARTIGLTYEVRPGPRVYVNRINILGNTRTQDQVIRRELRLAEGDAFASNKLQRSEDRLQRLEYFSDVKVSREETAQPDRVDLTISVKEQSTGEFNIGAGVSSDEGAIATASVRERNFLGRGQDLNLAFALSGERQDFDFSFTEPYFMGQELSAGLDLFNRRRELQDQSSYSRRDVGGGLSLGFTLDEYTRNRIALGMAKTSVEDIGTAASVFINNLAGDRDAVTVSNTFTHDTRDSFLTPMRGYNLGLTTVYAGLGGDVEYLKNTLSGSYHYSLTDDWTLSVGGRVAYLWDINDDTPLYENFFLGGQTLRGFARAGVGPRDLATSDALGGQLMYGHNVELRFPFPYLRESGVQGVFFWDGGIVTDFNEQPQNQVVNDEVYRMSLGAGIFWRSPLGPLRLDFGFPIVKGDRDEKELFSFSIGTRF